MIAAVGDYILVEPVYNKKSNLIIIPDSAQKQVSEFYGLVLSVGPEYPYRDQVKKGMKILFTRNEGTEVDDKYLSLKPNWVLAILEEE